MEKFNPIKYKNDYNREHYARLSVNVPIEEKDNINKHWKNKGFKSFNDYVKALIYKDMNSEKVVIHAETIEQNGDNNTINIG